jgi:hypothetical protein
VLKCWGKTPFLQKNCMPTPRITLKRNAMIIAICGAFVLNTQASWAQAPYDMAARVSLANEINQTYGSLVTPSLSIAELFDIKNRLDKADSIGRTYGVDLDYREHSFIELCDIESRIRIALTINQQYGKNMDWRAYGYSQLVQIEQQLDSKLQVPRQ